MPRIVYRSRAKSEGQRAKSEEQRAKSEGQKGEETRAKLGMLLALRSSREKNPGVSCETPGLPGGLTGPVLPLGSPGLGWPGSGPNSRNHRRIAIRRRKSLWDRGRRKMPSASP